jgi:hypothetical protein
LVKIKESGFNYYFLSYSEESNSFIITEDPIKGSSYFEFRDDVLDEIKSLLPKLNTIANKNILIYEVEESNPFGGRSSSTWFFDEDEAEDYYDELCDSQGGRSSYDDDEGGMDYSMDTIERPFKDILCELYQDMSAKEFIDYVKSLDNDEELLEERAIELDGKGNAYAVQDSLTTQKTHDATGKSDISIKNGAKDSNLTTLEKDVAAKSVEVLKQMGKLDDINKEFNVSRGPDLVYMPVDDTVKVTPDNGAKPYKIKIPEALAKFKSYEYDLLEGNILALLNKDRIEECKKALEDNHIKITETITDNLNEFGYLENEAILLKF